MHKGNAKVREKWNQGFGNNPLKGTIRPKFFDIGSQTHRAL
jgi:hypothetical protein